MTELEEIASATVSPVDWGLGEHLARSEMRVVAEEVLRLMPDVELAPDYEPQWLPARTVRGLKTLPVRYTPFEL